MISNIAAYHFAPLTELESLKARLKAECTRLKLKGTILLAPEGINVFLAGSAQSIAAIIATLCAIDGLAALSVKTSFSEVTPFKRLYVKIKPEIISFGVVGIDPLHQPAPRVAPEQLKQWLDEKRDVVLLDTRNGYEMAYGTFENAIDPKVRHFRHFAQAAAQLPSELKHHTVVTFCTGGIRCEKAAPFLQRQGFTDVYQLDGGILNYFEKCGGAHFKGSCFVFDERISLTPNLTPA